MAGTCWFRKSSRRLQMVQHVTFLFCTSNNKVWYISLILAACFDRCTITATAIIATLAQWALLLVQCLSKTSRFPNVLLSREPHDTSINCCASVLAKREQDNVIIVASSDTILMGTRSRSPRSRVDNRTAPAEQQSLPLQFLRLLSDSFPLGNWFVRVCS